MTPIAVTIAVVTAFFSAWKASLVEPAKAPAPEIASVDSPAVLGPLSSARARHTDEAIEAPENAPGEPMAQRVSVEESSFVEADFLVEERQS